jgi:biopolymer transport protein ExbB/TolQ
MSALIVGTLARDIQEWIYNAAEILLYPVLIAALVCLVWVFVELGWLCYEIYLRIRFRDLEALEIRTLRARQAFIEGKPRKAYRYLQETRYSMVVARFLFDLIRNYQTQRLAVKPLKLLQEYEFYTVKRLERTRILVRVGPMLGLMGTLIPLAPALVGLAQGDTQQLADNLVLAFSVTVVGLLIGGIAFAVSIVRDRIYSQDISDLEYLLELLEGGGERLPTGSRRAVQAEPRPAAAEPAGSETAELPLEALVPGAAADETVAYAADDDGDDGDDDNGDEVPLPLDDPDMSWYREDDPFASLGPVDSPDDDARPHDDR